MLEIWHNLNAVLDLFKVGNAAWPVVCAGIIKVILSCLKSDLGPIKRVVGGVQRLYAKLPTPDLDYAQTMHALVWIFAGALSILTYVTGGHSWTQAATAFASGGLGAFGVHETAKAWLPAPVETSGGQSSIRTPSDS